MKILIVEDERLAADKLIKLLKQTVFDAEVLTVLESVEESVNWFSTNQKPDLIFMDIQLDDGISFEIFDAVNIDVPVIFTTAYDEYAIRAFKVNSVDYLLKPIEKGALIRALEKFKRIHPQSTGLNDSLVKVINQISKNFKTRFLVRVGLRFQSVPVEEICCFFVEERSAFLNTTEGKIYNLDYSLEQIQKMIDPDRFFRINRNFIVNINCIDEMVSYSSSRIKLKLTGKTFSETIVSRERISDFKSWMDR